MAAVHTGRSDVPPLFPRRVNIVSFRKYAATATIPINAILSHGVFIPTPPKNGKGFPSPDLDHIKCEVLDGGRIRSGAEDFHDGRIQM
jgi:hypothetical protein